jgi:formylglycine-generating enzyme required for sulfatase activity
MDWHDEKYYAQSPRVDPAGPQRGAVRVNRGHGGGAGAPLCRSAFRDGNEPSFRAHNLGLRVCLAGDTTDK